jgi:hypothetical protein
VDGRSLPGRLLDFAGGGGGGRGRRHLPQFLEPVVQFSLAGGLDGHFGGAGLGGLQPLLDRHGVGLVLRLESAKVDDLLVKGGRFILKLGELGAGHHALL